MIIEPILQLEGATPINLRVSGIIIEREKLLMTAHDYPSGRLWHLPGGKVEEGETLADALIREFNEEISIGIEVDSLAFICEEIHTHLNHTIHCVFTARHLTGTPVIRLEQTSASEVAFVPLTEITRMSLYPHLPAEIVRISSSKIVSGEYLGLCPKRHDLL